MSPLLFIENLIKNGQVADANLDAATTTWGLQHDVARLEASLRSAEFGLDQAVMLRQCLRHLGNFHSIVVDHVSPRVSRYFSDVGIKYLIDGTVETLPYRPYWISGPTPQGIDVPATNFNSFDIPVPGEGWLIDRFGKTVWRSQAQREAVWDALISPPNSTLLVGLPTGAGKSLVYQVCASFQPGLTVVVVPTVALGIDQINSLRSMPIAQTHNPLLYTSDVNSSTVLEELRIKQCRLLITSPEAIVAGRLGPTLSTLAEDGWFERFVVDEAHIVDSWGSSFRVEFQLLGAQLHTWRERSPYGIRTLLLSATFGPGTTETLRLLFAGSHSAWKECVIQRLRPEPHYFSPGVALDEEQHHLAVVEALLRLPRPAIMYLTERRQVEIWGRRLSGLGLKRLECFHGETPQRERARILEAWRNDNVDLIVATSAFGMGVDKTNVRSVIHACFPENIDRYYQEVGRGGRDGAPCSAVAIWTAKDRAIGGSMGPKLLKDEIKISERWAAIWHKAERTTSPDLFKVPVWVSPNYKYHERTSEESVTWNKRLLLMMQRAGILRINSVYIEPGEEPQERREWVTIRALLPTTSLENQVSGLLQEPRTQELVLLETGRDRLDRLLSNRVQVCRVLREHYGRSTHRTCGSCALCRSDPTMRSEPAPLALQFSQQSTTPMVDIVYGPSTVTKSDQGILVMALRRVIHERLSWRFFTGEHFHKHASHLLAIAASHGENKYRLDILAGDAHRSIRQEEVVICLHDQNLHSQAKSLHSRGAVCSHWVLNAQPDYGSSRWSFLHENQSRLFTGQNSFNDWINSRLQIRRHQQGTSGVH